VKKGHQAQSTYPQAQLDAPDSCESFHLRTYICIRSRVSSSFQPNSILSLLGGSLRYSFLTTRR
jgi:hypothetical protein